MEDDHVFREDSWNEDDNRPDPDEGENWGVGMEETHKILYEILNQKKDGEGENKQII